MPDSGIASRERSGVLRAFKDAVSLSSHVLQRSPDQMPSALYGRLWHGAGAPVRELLDTEASRISHPWLRPVNRCMTQPQSGVVCVARVSASGVQAVAATIDGTIAIAAPAPIETVVHRRDGAIVPSALREGAPGAIQEAWDPLVIDLGTGRQIAALVGHGDDVNAVAITPDGSRAITGCGRRAAALKWFRASVAEPRPSRDNAVRLWELPGGRLLDTFEGHSAAVTCVCTTVDGKFAVSGSDDSTALVWDLESGEQVLRFEEHSGGIRTIGVVRMAPLDGSKLDLVLSASSSEYLAWQLDTGEVRARMPLEALYDEALGFSLVEVTVFFARETIGSSEPFKVHATSMSTGERHASARFERPFAVFAVSFLGDAALVAQADDTAIGRWTLNPLAEEARLVAHTGDVTCACFTSGDTRAVTGSMDGNIVLWDLKTAGGELAEEAHESDVNSMAAARSGNVVVSGSYDRTVKLSRAPDCSDTRLLGNHNRSVTSVAVSADGNTAVSGSLDGTVRAWSTSDSSGEPWFTGRHGAQIQIVAISPDGSTAFSGADDGTVKSWAFSNDDAGAELLHHSSAIRGLAYDETTGRLIVGAEDGAVLITGGPAGDSPNVLVTHPSPVTALVPGPDATVVVGDYAGTIAQYARDGTLVWDAHAFGGAIWGLGMTPDQALAVAVSDDGTLRAWRTRDWTEVASFVADTPLYSVAVGSDGSVFAGAGAQSGRLNALRLENRDSHGGQSE